MNYHNQCLLQKADGSTQITWIPSRFAKEKAWLKLKKEDGTWDDGWQVMSIGSKMDTKFVQERTQDYKKMRKVTDI